MSQIIQLSLTPDQAHATENIHKAIAQFLNTPKELLLERELNNYEFQFDLLSQRLEQMEDVMTEIENRDHEIYRAYFEASPIPEEQRRAGFGGVNRYKKLEGFGNSGSVILGVSPLEISSNCGCS